MPDTNIRISSIPYISFEVRNDTPNELFDALVGDRLNPLWEIPNSPAGHRNRFIVGILEQSTDPRGLWADSDIIFDVLVEVSGRTSVLIAIRAGVNAEVALKAARPHLYNLLASLIGLPRLGDTAKSFH